MVCKILKYPEKINQYCKCNIEIPRCAIELCTYQNHPASSTIFIRCRDQSMENRSVNPPLAKGISPQVKEVHIPENRKIIQEQELTTLHQNSPSIHTSAYYHNRVNQYCIWNIGIPRKDKSKLQL